MTTYAWLNKQQHDINLIPSNDRCSDMEDWSQNYVCVESW